MSPRIVFPKSLAWYVTLGLLASLSVSYSDDISVSVTVINRTEYYLHVTINGKAYTNLAPENSINTEVSTATVSISAFYSPAQGQSGSFSKSYPTVARENYRSSGQTSCRSSNSHNSCTSTTEPETGTRITSLPVRVEIFPRDLQ
jgi:hypothetical protein